MTIREVAEKAGLSNQAIYKRLKARGVQVADIRQNKTGQLTEEGEALMRELFPILQDEAAQAARPASDEAAAPPPPPAPDEVERLTTENQRLMKEVDELTTRLTTTEARAQALQEERDYLRGALEKSQQLQALTASKIPNPPPAITDGREDQQRRGWWARLRSKARGDT